MVSLEIGSLIVFVAVVGALLLRDRKNIQFNYGIVMKRWTKGLDLIDRIVKNRPRLIRWIGNFGVGLGLFAGIAGLVLLTLFTIKLQQTFALVLPTAGGYQIPGPVVSIPFWYWLIAIFIIASTHETMHAIFIRLEKVPVKNYGILLLLFLPIGAFVDPDERKIKRLSTLKKLRIFAAGSFANFITGILAIAILIAATILFALSTAPAGVVIESVAEDSPAEKVNLEGVINKMDNMTVKSTFDFVEALKGKNVGENITITTDKGRYELTLAQHPETENRTYIGITGRELLTYSILGLQGEVSPTFLNIFLHLMTFVNWLLLVSIGVGIVNMLPVKPFDGGLFFEEIFVKLFKERGHLLIKITTFSIIAIFLFNLFGIQIIKSLI